jgi:hypothetical protein
VVLDLVIDIGDCLFPAVRIFQRIFTELDEGTPDLLGGPSARALMGATRRREALAGDPAKSAWKIDSASAMCVWNLTASAPAAAAASISRRATSRSRSWFAPASAMT